MKHIELFFIGMKKSIKQSWLLILVLIVIIIVSLIGFNFCYRMFAFWAHQPEQYIYYGGDDYLGYSIDGEINCDDSIFEIDDSIVKVRTTSAFQLNGTEFPLNSFIEDVYNEKIISKIHFEKQDKVLVANKSLPINIGENINIGGVTFKVIGITNKNSYIPYGAISKLNGIMHVIVDEQLSVKNITNLEKAVGSKIEKNSISRQFKDPSSLLFLILAVIVFLLGSFNIYKLFGTYIDKNKNRYNLYNHIGMTLRQTNLFIILEGAIICLFSLVIGFIIDAFAMAPLTVLNNIKFLYNSLDILLLGIISLLSAIVAINIKVSKRMANNKLKRFVRR